MELYHTSYKVYKVGQIISSSDFDETEYSSKTKKKWVDETLDSLRPIGFPERKRSVFASDSISNCYAFIKTRECEDKPKYYKVCMQDPKPCPMCLTEFISECNQDLNKRIASEYWGMTKKWKFIEYLSNEMTILEIVDEPESFMKMTATTPYNNDRDQAKILFGE